MDDGLIKLSTVFVSSIPCSCGRKVVYFKGKRCRECGRIRLGAEPVVSTLDQATIQQLIDMMDELFFNNISSDEIDFCDVSAIHNVLKDKITKFGGICLVEPSSEYGRDYWRLLTFHINKGFEVLPVKDDHFDREGYIEHYKEKGLDTERMMSRLSIFNLDGPFLEGKNLV
jgi:hypothetical protein